MPARSPRPPAEAHTKRSMMNQRFESKVAIVTGGSRGIGWEIARQLHAEGASVVITGRREDVVAQAAEAIGSRVLGVAGSAEDRDHQAATVAMAVDRFGPIDYLVNNAGVSLKLGHLVDIDLDRGRDMVELNVMAPLGWAQEVWRSGLGERGGAIVNIASASAFRSSKGLALYGATKSMLLHLTRTMALECAPVVRVNAVAPGLVRSDFTADYFDGNDPGASLPMGRAGEPMDIAKATLFLLSDDASWITGDTLVVDGGIVLAGNPARPQRPAAT